MRWALGLAGAGLALVSLNVALLIHNDRADVELDESQTELLVDIAQRVESLEADRLAERRANADAYAYLACYHDPDTPKMSGVGVPEPGACP